MPTTAGSGVFQKGYSTSIAFLVALLLFFLPFVVIKCNNQPYAENTGLGLALGTNYNVTAQKDLPDILQKGKNESVTREEEKGKLYVLALASLLAGIVGLMFSLSRSRSASSVSMLMGMAAALCLVILMFQISSDIKRNSGGNVLSGRDSNIRVTASYTIWYFIAIASFLAAAFFSYKRRDITISPGGDRLRPERSEDGSNLPDGW